MAELWSVELRFTEKKLLQMAHIDFQEIAPYWNFDENLESEIRSNPAKIVIELIYARVKCQDGNHLEGTVIAEPVG